MRLEHRLKSLESVAAPERVLVVVAPGETLAQATCRIGLAPDARVVAVHTGVPRAASLGGCPLE